MDEDPLSGPQPAPGEDHPEGGEPGERESGGLPVGKMLRDRSQVGGGDADELGEGPVPVLSQNAEGRAERLLAFEAERAAAAGEPGIEDDPLSDAPPIHPRPHRIDHPHPVGAADVGEGQTEPRQSFQDEQVQVIEGRGAQPDADLARSGDRIGNSTQGNLIETSQSLDKDGFHGPTILQP